MKRLLTGLLSALLVTVSTSTWADDPLVLDIPESRQNPLWVERNPDGSVKAGGLQNQEIGPCEELGNPTLDTDKRVTVELNQRERELIHLAVIGFRSDMEHERDGVGGWKGGVFPGSPPKPNSHISTAAPPFFARAFFLNYFIKVVVPSISERVYGMDRFSDTGSPGDATEAELENSVQTITFTACERAGLSIATEKWSAEEWGQMGRHLRLCDHSVEMNASSACASFRPLGTAYGTLRPKIEQDQ
jgi:hypothetical protein